jgi:hypothetical protein
MELEAKKVTIVTNDIEFENYLQFDFNGGYFKVSRPNGSKILRFETKNKTIEIPIAKLSIKKNKRDTRWIKFESVDDGYILAYFFIKDTEKDLAKDIICDLTKSENSTETLIFKWEWNQNDNENFDKLLNTFYDTIEQRTKNASA